MNRSRTIWAGGLLSLSLALGCKHTQPQTEECSTCCATSQAQPATAAPRLALVPTPSLVPTAPQTPAPLAPLPIVVRPSPSPAAPRTLPPVTSVPAPAPQAAAVPAPQAAVNPEQSAPPTSPWAMPKVETVAPSPVATPAATPAPAPTVSTVPAANPAPIPVVAATPAGPSPQYYNSPDYSILFGVLDYNARRGTWRLRFADAGDEDRYGGSVTLDGVGRQMEGYASGQFVRVEGGLVDPESHDASPAYRVKEMRPATAGK